MPHFSYSFQGYDKTKHVRASLRDANISHKEAREICKAIKEMKISRAREYLEQVTLLKQPIPFRRYKLEVGHRSQLQGFPAGRYPVKAAKEFLYLLDNIESNAEYKGMDINNMKIIHAAAYPGIKIRNFIERAFGRTSPYYNILTHVELVAMEV
jgi:large subunit ribosomal protein L22